MLSKEDPSSCPPLLQHQPPPETCPCPVLPRVSKKMGRVKTAPSLSPRIGPRWSPCAAPVAPACPCPHTTPPLCSLPGAASRPSLSTSDTVKMSSAAFEGRVPLPLGAVRAGGTTPPAPEQRDPFPPPASALALWHWTFFALACTLHLIPIFISLNLQINDPEEENGAFSCSTGARGAVRMLLLAGRACSGDTRRRRIRPRPIPAALALAGWLLSWIRRVWQRLLSQDSTPQREDDEKVAPPVFAPCSSHCPQLTCAR